VRGYAVCRASSGVRRKACSPVGALEGARYGVGPPAVAIGANAHAAASSRRTRFTPYQSAGSTQALSARSNASPAPRTSASAPARPTIWTFPTASAGQPSALNGKV